MDWNFYSARAAEYGVPVPMLMAMAVKSEFSGSVGRRFIIEHALWIFPWENKSSADLSAAVDRCILEKWFRVSHKKRPKDAPHTAMNEPPFIEWAAQGLILARKIFGESVQ
jgi:hypothetical protein